MTDLHLLIAHQHAHPLLEQGPGHAVPVALHLDAGVVVDHPHQLSFRQERRLMGQRLQGSGLLPLETHHRLFTGRSVDANVGHLPAPALQMGLQRLPAGELSAGHRIGVDVTDATLVLPLGAGPVGPASFGDESPVAGKGVEPFVEHQQLASRVVLLHQGTGVVKQNLGRHPPPVAEGLLHRQQPVDLALVPVGPHHQPPRVAQGQHAQVHLDPFTSDAGIGLTEIRLQLLARRRLKPDRRQRCSPQLLPPLPHRPLHGAQ